MVREYDHVIQWMIQNIKTHGSRDLHCNNMLIIDRESRKHRGKGQANDRVYFEAAKRAPISYYYRCKYTAVHTLASPSFLLLVHEELGSAFAWMDTLQH